MFPILLLSRDEKKTNSFIDALIKDNDYHPTALYRFYPDETRIKIENIREINSLFSRSFKNKIMIVVYSFETAREEAQNAFLKTLEEKNTIAQFVLVAQDETQILPTIISRSKIIKLNSGNLVNKKKNAPDFKVSLAQSMAIHGAIKKDKAIVLLDAWLWYFREKLTTLKYAPQVLKEILRVRSLQMKNNLNAQVAIDHLLIFIYKCAKST